MSKTNFKHHINLLFIISFFFIKIIQKDISRIWMDITIDFTDHQHHKLSQLSNYPYLRSVTFVLPFFQQLKHNFAYLYQYVSYLNDKPLVKIFVKPQGQEFKAKYKTVAVGGTFDHLHIGHQMLLLHAVLLAEKKVIIGITSQAMLQKKANKQIIQSYLMRQNQVRQFVKNIKPQIQIQFVQLQDPYGPTISQQNIDAIALSPETLKVGQTINQKRKQKGYHPLTVQNIPIMGPVRHLTSIRQIQNKISSTQIRNHILAKNGLTIEKYSQYQEIWMRMIDRINKILQIQQKDNHLINRKWWDIVVKYYSQYWRYYHTNHHIASMFRQLFDSPEMGYQKLSDVDKIVLQISIFFHDIIYRPDLKNNEQDSAHFAQAFINQIWKGKQQIKSQIISKVKASILATQLHHYSTDIEKILCDLDMSILDADLQKYKTFAFNVQRQYRPLLKETYPAKRLEFLQKILGNYKFNWRKGDNMENNLKWQIQHWKNQN